MGGLGSGWLWRCLRGDQGRAFGASGEEIVPAPAFVHMNIYGAWHVSSVIIGSRNWGGTSREKGVLWARWHIIGILTAFDCLIKIALCSNRVQVYCGYHVKELDPLPRWLFAAAPEL